jgi:hypothetical protein
VIWILLASGIVLACWWLPPQTGPRQGHVVSLLSWLPGGLVASPRSSIALRGLLLVGCVLWLLNKWLPGRAGWSCSTFTAVWSLHIETRITLPTSFTWQTCCCDSGHLDDSGRAAHSTPAG